MFNLSLHQINRLGAGDKDSEWKEEGRGQKDEEKERVEDKQTTAVGE